MTDRQALYRRVAELHFTCIDQGFLRTLGRRFLCLLYRAIDESPDATLLVAERDGRIAGFVAGGLGMRPIYRRMLARWPELAVALAPSLVRPSRVRRIFETMMQGKKKEGGADLPRAELLSIAVDPAFRGQGIAEELFELLCVDFEARGEREFRIVVGESLAPAHRFYRRMGAVPVCQVEVHKGARSTIYVATARPSARDDC